MKMNQHHRTQVGVTLLLIVIAFFTAKFPLEPQYSVISSLSVILFALPCYYGLFQTLGRKTALQLILMMCIFALVLENTAIYTGFPYGRFMYGSLIGERIGLVPWTVGFAWTPILFGAISLVKKWRVSSSVVINILAIAVLMTAFDFVLDPGSVSLGFWIWENSTGFYGVPWSNFLGWLLSSALAAVIVEVFLKFCSRSDVQFSSHTHTSFLLMLIFWTAACAFEQLWLPALIGCALLGVLSSTHFKKS
jgi:bisanhydrobacterioruberin hydratase